jgi:hypothetical protein
MPDKSRRWFPPAGVALYYDELSAATVLVRAPNTGMSRRMFEYVAVAAAPRTP